MFKICLLSVFLLPLALGDGVDVERCNLGTLPSFVYINHCEKTPCHFYKNDHIVAHVLLQAPINTQNLTAELDYIVGSERNHLALPDQIRDVCRYNHIHPPCPIKAEYQYLYVFKWDLKETITKFSRLRVELMLKGEDKVNIACLGLNADIHPTERPSEVDDE